MTVLVTGGTGTTGRLVAEGLRARGVGARVASRHGEVRFDWGDQETYAAVLSGVDAVYLVPPSPAPERFAELFGSFLGMARAAGVRRAVLLSSSFRGIPAFEALADAVADGFPEWAVLRPSWFMQNVLGAHPTAVEIREHGRISTAVGPGRVAFIDAADIADAAVATLLADPAPNTDYVLTGPAALTYREVAEILGEVSGRTIEYRDLTAEQRVDSWVEAGLPRATAERAAQVDLVLRTGVEDRTTTSVAELTGHPARTFREFAEQNKNAWTKETAAS